MSAIVPSLGGPLLCGGAQAITGQVICGAGLLPDTYLDFALELDGVDGVLVNPVLLPFDCTELDLAASACTPLDLGSLITEVIVLDPLVPLEA
jgi:hypothetical protein